MRAAVVGVHFHLPAGVPVDLAPPASLVDILLVARLLKFGPVLREDIDVSPWGNSGTKTQGVACTCKSCDG